MEIVNTFPVWIYLLCFVIGGLISYLFYRKDKKLEEFSKGIILVLMFLRFLTFGVITMLLLSPLLKHFTKSVEQPIIVVAHDKSSSIASDSSFNTSVNPQIEGFVNELKQEFDVASFTFDETTKEKTEPIQYDGKATNYESLFEEIESRFVNQNVGGIILISDGIYNQGSNPTYFSTQFDFPIYTVGLGDTVAYKDAQILKVRNNKVAFLGNEFPVEIDIRIKQAKAEEILLQIDGPDGNVFQEKIEPDTKDFLKTIRTTITAKTKGIQKYRVSLTLLNGERNRYNNSTNFYVDVLDGRQKIALLPVAPHPDIATLKRSIENNENYELKVSLLEDFQLDKEEYDLLILHQSIDKPDYPYNETIKKIVKTELPILLIGGNWETLGVQFGIKPVNGNKNSQNEAFPIYNTAFTLFTITENLQEQLIKFPPLLVERSNLNNTFGNTVLLNQKIGAVATKFPLIEFFQKEKRKIGRWYGENLWKWSMNDYSIHQNHDNFNELISKVIQYLAIKSDRSLFRVSSANEFYENEPITFDAQLFNDSYQLISDEEVTIVITNNEGKEYPYSFNVSGDRYQLSIASLPPNDYKYVAKSTVGGKALLEKGDFLVKELQLEQLESVANHNLLYQLSNKTGGELVYPNQLKDLVAKLKSREDITSISYQNEEIEDIIELKWIFFLLIGLLSLEWFIRKRGGAY